MYTYNPSFINPQAQLNNYLNEQMNEAARTGYSKALGDTSHINQSRALGALAGALTAKLIFDLFDR